MNHLGASLDEGARARATGADHVPSDEEIVARVRHGKTADFALLMRRYNQRMFRTVRCIVSDPAIAEDLVQEAYLKAYAKLDQYRGPQTFGAWLSRIALNEARSWVRRPAPCAMEVEPAASAVSAERQAGQVQLVRELERALDQLPSDYRAVFVLRAVEELSTRECASSLGIPEDTVKTRLHRARKLLLRRLGRDYHQAVHELLPFAGARCRRTTSAVLRRLPLSPWMRLRCRLHASFEMMLGLYEPSSER